MKHNLRIIGDVHGLVDKYNLLIRKAKLSIQLGDFGFDYKSLRGVDYRKHRILGGNHDNYNEIINIPHYLGNYGIIKVPKIGEIFFIRGGFSRDKWCRITGVSWWPEEEMSMMDCIEALECFKEIRPNFVISHECPCTILPYVLPNSTSAADRTRTNMLLQNMLDVHRPKQWVFAHYHVSWNQVIDGTHFRCLNELECYDL